MMRGDKKWPPEQTKQQMVDDEEEQKKIAQGPAFKPKKVPKVVMNIWWFDLKLLSCYVILRITLSFSGSTNWMQHSLDTR